MNEHLHTSIEVIELSKGLLDDSMKHRLNVAIGMPSNDDNELFSRFEPSELDILYTMIQVLQKKVITSSGDLLADCSARDIASLVGATTSLLRAFSAEQKKLDDVREMGNLKEAVLASIMTLDTEAQSRFFKTLESFE